MRKYMWWPDMKVFIGEYIKKCLICARLRPVQGRTLRGLLEKPVLFQMVSLDYVGPFMWFNKDCWVLFIVDHASRFAVTELFDSKPTAMSTAKAFAQKWVNIFGMPEAVLCDRGTEFTGADFRLWVLNDLCTRVVYTSPSYPQGNGINEKCHQSIMHSVHVRAQVEPSTHVSELLRDATLVYNAIPKVSTGRSPFCVLTGLEMRLPGLASFCGGVDEQSRCLTISEMRFRALVRSQVVERDFSAQEKIAENEIVVRLLTDYERQHHVGTAASASMRFIPKWSLPCKVIKVLNDGVSVLVKGLWDLPESEPVQVATRNIKVFQMEIPEPLYKEALKLIQHERPKLKKIPSHIWDSYGRTHNITNTNGNSLKDTLVQDTLQSDGKKRRISHRRATLTQAEGCDEE
eukprot:Lankesteria_metandrocarpae@DN5491_c1_g1_i1.p1